MKKKSLNCEDKNKNKYFNLTKIEQDIFLELAGFTPSEKELFNLRCNTDYTIRQLEDVLNSSQKAISNKITSIKFKMDKLKYFFDTFGFQL